MKDKINVFWFRRDLRLADNAGLYHALKVTKNVLPVFIFDKNILDKLEDKKDARVSFIYDTIADIQENLLATGNTLHVLYDTPVRAFETLLKKYNIEKVFTNEDYENYARERDEEITALLKKHDALFESFKDQVIFSKDEVLKDDGKPYTVFTPYSRKWKAMLKPFHLKSYPTEKYFSNFLKQEPIALPALKKMGFEKSGQSFPARRIPKNIIKEYGSQRNFPGIHGTSHMGLHLRFGTLSIRMLARESKTISEVYMNELIWRDFYHMITWHYPHVGNGKAFKPAYDNIKWRNNEDEFKKWCEGKTGYPIVDAGMRELNETGFMHNRIRMVTASFLSKHLLMDWRLGEAYFAEKLLDYDFAANNGGWQWAAGSGCDAAPYFRIFNPYLQTKKFDPDLAYIKKWVPEFDQADYPPPIVEHSFARERCLKVYKAALSGT